ncbi:MAG: rhodanese-related sulfurtransferase [Xenococcaceae cyanobacterium MO_188.B32]|nr:rhodanese-related sulfurtransferase [Xenococcaceae cyanobacterium MO_188.B32]
MSQVVVTFYKFVRLEDCINLKQPLLAYCQQQEIKGTILLATEGINGTIAGKRNNIEAVLAWLRQDARLADLEHKESLAKAPPFKRMKVKIKREIVTIGKPDVNPTQQVGTYVKPSDWNDIISDTETMVIDTRNNYEVNIGTFKGAINPQTESFRQFTEYAERNLDPQKQKKVAMFCTGGIRCEKASSYLLSQGFQEVYHLKGGILKYIEEIPAEESLWQGECFVFDERVTVKHGLAQGSYNLCYACGHPISPTDLASPYYEENVSCPHCYSALTPEKEARQREKKRQRQQQKKNI